MLPSIFHFAEAKIFIQVDYLYFGHPSSLLTSLATPHAGLQRLTCQNLKVCSQQLFRMLIKVQNLICSPQRARNLKKCNWYYNTQSLTSMHWFCSIFHSLIFFFYFPLHELVRKHCKYTFRLGYLNILFGTSFFLKCHL